MKQTKSNRVPKQKMAGAFPAIESIPYEGPKSTNPLAFRHYNADEIVAGKTMREHLRFSVVYWHDGAPLGRRFEHGPKRPKSRSRRFRIHAEAGGSLLRLA
jgi:hypothetical protein